MKVIFIPLEQNKNFNHIKKYVKRRFSCIEKLSEDTKMLKFNQYKKI